MDSRKGFGSVYAAISADVSSVSFSIAQVRYTTSAGVSLSRRKTFLFRVNQSEDILVTRAISSVMAS